MPDIPAAHIVMHITGFDSPKRCTDSIRPHGACINCMQAKQSLLQNRILKNAQHATNTYSTDRLSRTCLYFTYKAEPVHTSV